MGTEQDKVNEHDKIKAPLLALPEWVRGREGGQFNQEFSPGDVPNIYRAGYVYGAIEREVVLTQLSILFISAPGFLEAELFRLGGIEVPPEELSKGLEYLLEKHLALLWPEASRRA